MRSAVKGVTCSVLSLGFFMVLGALPLLAYGEPRKGIPASALDPSASGGSARLLSPDLFLYEAVRSGFIPQQVFFLVSFDDQPFSRYQAHILPPFVSVEEPGKGSRGEATQRSSGSLRTWRAGVQVAVPTGSRQVTYAVIVASEGNRFSLMPLRTLSVSDERLFGGNTLELRSALIERKELLRSAEGESQALEAELRRLRADADLIADIGRIAEVRDEIEATRAAAAAVEADQESLRSLVALAKTNPEPRNFIVRERQLVRQNSALTELAKRTEGGEFARRSESKRELDRKLAVIREASSIDELELRTELLTLRASNAPQKELSPTHESPVLREGESLGESPDDYVR